MSTSTLTALTVRAVTPDDAEACARIFYDAFAAFAGGHNLPVEPGSPQFTAMRTQWMLAQPGVEGVVAERDGDVVACAWADERGAIVGIGPVAVDPAYQGTGAGRAVMEALLARAREREVPGVRLVQTAYNHCSLALYSRLGFVIREPLVVVAGEPPRVTVPGREVRPATRDDLAAADALCRAVHGHDRAAELRDAVDAGMALVVERAGELSGYATGVGYGFHAVGLTDGDVCALLAAPEHYLGLGVLVPGRNHRLLRWCLDHGLRIVQTSTLMSAGLYNEPAGAWLPSIAY